MTVPQHANLILHCVEPQHDHKGIICAVALEQPGIEPVVSRSNHRRDGTGVSVELAPGVLLRPSACGLLVLVDSGAPVALPPLQERIVAVCLRATRRSDLVAILGGEPQVESGTVEIAIDELIAGGVLRAS